MDSASHFCSGVLAGLKVSAPAAAESFDRGQALYENNCQACHDTAVHMRAGRRAASRSDIGQCVTTWSLHAGLGWSGKENNDVTDFLNTSICRFTSR
jgi:cytochrome c5